MKNFKVRVILYKLSTRATKTGQRVNPAICFVGCKVEPWYDFCGWLKNHVKSSDIPKKYFFDIKNCNVSAGTIMVFDGDCLQRY